uniref:TipC139 protein n=1 Tax=Saimiriine herpesvirus 2 TaxID=10381 RepID=P88823_SHV2|nr:TipC139 [Saimiriine gammaherpesvirus 2]
MASKGEEIELTEIQETENKRTAEEMASKEKETELTEILETENKRKAEEKLPSCSEETTDTSSSSSSEQVPAPIEVNVNIETSTYMPQNVLTDLNCLYTSFEDARAQGKGLVRHNSEDLESFLKKYPRDYRKPKRDLSETWDPGMPKPPLPPRPANLGASQASTLGPHVREPNFKQLRQRKANEEKIVKDLKRLENKVNIILCLVVVILAILILVTGLSILFIRMKS